MEYGSDGVMLRVAECIRGEDQRVVREVQGRHGGCHPVRGMYICDLPKCNYPYTCILISADKNILFKLHKKTSKFILSYRGSLLK